MELAKHKIRVNCIAPGLIRTKFGEVVRACAALMVFQLTPFIIHGIDLGKRRKTMQNYQSCNFAKVIKMAFLNQKN